MMSGKVKGDVLKTCTMAQPVITHELGVARQLCELIHQEEELNPNMCASCITFAGENGTKINYY